MALRVGIVGLHGIGNPGQVLKAAEADQRSWQYMLPRTQAQK